MIQQFQLAVAATMPYLNPIPAFAMKCSLETSLASIDVATTYQGSVFPPRKYPRVVFFRPIDTTNPSPTATNMYAANTARSRPLRWICWTMRLTRRSHRRLRPLAVDDAPDIQRVRVLQLRRKQAVRQVLVRNHPD